MGHRTALVFIRTDIAAAIIHTAGGGIRKLSGHHAHGIDAQDDRVGQAVAVGVG